MGNQRPDESSRNQPGQQQGADQSGGRQQGQQNTNNRPGQQQGGGQRSEQQGGAGGGKRQQEQQRGAGQDDSPRTPDEIGQGDLDAGEIGSVSSQKEDRERGGSQGSR